MPAIQVPGVALSETKDTAYIVGGRDGSFQSIPQTWRAALPLGPPPGQITILRQPSNQTTVVATNVIFTVNAYGAPPLSYQWRKNGVRLAGATSATLTLNSVTAADSGGYSVVVSNANGAVVSDTAHLAVLTDGANEQASAQLAVSPDLAPPVAVDSLVVVTHGFQIQLGGEIEWVNTMASSIRQDLESRNLANWRVLPFQWRDSAGPLPAQALINAVILGKLKGKEWAQHPWRHVHLIGHSAGSAFIESAAKRIKQQSPDTTIHCTFLDPYLSVLLVGNDVYGANANWSDSYFAQDWSGGFTGDRLANAYNVDVSWEDPNRQPVGYGNGQVAFSSHSWSHDFYQKTISNTDPNWCAKGYGFALSRETMGDAWNNQASHPPNNEPLVLCGPTGAVRNPNPGITSALVLVADAQHALSAFGASLAGKAGFLMSTVLPQPSPQGAKQIGTRALGEGDPVGEPAWLAVGVPVTNAVNFVQFDAGFVSPGVAEGLLTVYWNTNQVGMVDERVASPGLQSYRFALPGTETNGLFALSFRLDAFHQTASSIAVTNVATGFVGVTQPITLEAAGLAPNGAPVLKLTGAPDYTYLIQASTNLLDWTPTALLANTNGTVLFAEPGPASPTTRFYRATLP